MGDPSETTTPPSSDRADLVLDALERRSGRTTVGELAAAVARAEEGAGSYGAVHEDLFCRLLPSLEARGELRFEAERGLVVREPGGGSSLLGRIRGRLRTWIRR